MSTKRLLLIGSINSGTKNNVLEIAQLLHGQSLDVDTANWEDLLFTISTERQEVVHKGKNIADAYDLVIAFNWYKSGKLSIYRDVALTLALYLNDRNVQFWNSEMLHQRSTTKLSMMMQLALSGIDIPATLYSLNAKLLSDSCANAVPCIVKGMAASRGADNYLVRKSEELQSILGFSPENRFLVQEFIPNSSDLRLVCAGGSAVMAIERKRRDETTHLNNTSQGASAEQIELSQLPHEILTKTEKICKITGRELAGVDWMFANDGSDRKVCLEVNAIPQLSSGTYVETKIFKIGQKIRQSLDKEQL